MNDEELIIRKGLFAFSDPGGAKGVLALIHRLKKKGYKDYRVISNRFYEFYIEFDITVKIIKNDLSKFLEEHNPEFIFTGTSYTTDFELRCISFAKKNKLQSYTYIDHWTDIKKRFKYKYSFIFPEKILVLDQKAYDIALNDGIPEKLLESYHNPYIEYLQDWKPSISKNEFLKRNGIKNKQAKVISYLPEPLSNVGGVSKFGLDEYSCLEFLYNALIEIDYHQLYIMIKIHPNQNKEKMRKKIFQLPKNRNINLRVIDDEINTLIYYSDIIIGIFSNALIEANNFEKPIFRILAGLKIDDPLDLLEVGTCVYSEKELINNIKF